MRLNLALVPLLILVSFPAVAEIDLHCHKVDRSPEIDGDPSDNAWTNAQQVMVPDGVADIEHAVRCVYTATEIHLLVSFPDETENRKHKTLVWSESDARYKVGLRREDTVVVKWNMEPEVVDLSLSADFPYKADIWYWKAYRTDHQGYADDKYHVYTNEPLRKSKKLLSKTGQRFYLRRSGDDGSAAYKPRIYTTNQGSEVPGYELNVPTGSRADVLAKGVWKDGVWNVEFSRLLITKSADDVQLDRQRNYSLGISRYEIAGARPKDRLEIPLFGSGELGPLLNLIFSKDGVSN